MDFIDELRTRAARFRERVEHVQTEEATKTAMVMPFIQTLGYNLFDPTEVVPEFTADIGTKKGEKVDYAIIKDGKPIVLIECKRVGTNFTEENLSQLLRYFSVTEARFGVLTDELIYRFYSDLDEPNRMDTKPFLEFNMLDFDDAQVEELKKFTKSSFDLEEIVDTARELKYTREIKGILAEQMRSPSEEFVRLFAAQVYSGRMTQAIREQFADLTRRAFQQIINDRISDRLKSALESEDQSTGGEEASQGAESARVATGATETQKDQPDRSEEEIQGYYVVKAILRDTIEAKRIATRDFKGLVRVLLDDNLRKPICGLWFKTSQKYLGLIDEEKREERIAIQDIDDIFTYADRLKAAVAHYEQGSADNGASVGPEHQEAGQS